MIFSKDEFDLIMADESKKIIDDIIWASKTDSLQLSIDTDLGMIS